MGIPFHHFFILYGGMKLKKLILSSKKYIWIACVLVFVAGLFFVWNNILILDDHHHEQWNDSIYAAGTPQEAGTVDENPAEGSDSGTKENTNNNNTGETKTDQTQQVSPSQNSAAVKKGWHLHINLDSCIMYVYKNGELVKTYPVSGGKPSTPSPVGTWRIIGKDTWGEGFGGAWLAINVPWGKYGIHGTYYPWFVGKSNSSKGCIRMQNKDVRELYKMVPHGTSVTIVQSSPVFRVLKNGHFGSDVKKVQAALKKLGYYKGGTDGKFGTGLQYAVQKFQKTNKLRATGIVNRSTWDRILQQAGL
jgi:lipoprotein-anchoring transpeptidase ErfK/SrfK